MNEYPCELDRVIARLLASVHPTNLLRLRDYLLLVLASTTGIGVDDSAFKELAAVRGVEELAEVDWEDLYARTVMSTCLSAQACWMLVEHMRLFSERCVLHHCLYLSRSASTLWLTNTWRIPPSDLPDALMANYGEFLRSLAVADAALQSGRASLHEFQRQVLMLRVIHTLQDMLRRANACYAEYLQALDLADQQARFILWSLSQMQENTADEDGLSQPSFVRHVA